jgi:predicted amidohydrolase
VRAAQGVAAVIVAGIQHDIAWEDPAANFVRLAPRIEHAASEGARLVVLTEMFATGFSMKTERVAEPVGGPSTRFLVEQAAEHRVWVCGSVPEAADTDDKPFNQLVLAGPGGELHRYAKIHPFSYGREHEHYRAGDQYLTVAVDGVRCSFFVCYDLRFADAFWDVAPVTDCYVVPANWPASRREHWMALLRARAIENQAYVVGVNRVGDGGRLHYCGDSMIIDPLGDVLAQAAEAEETVASDLSAERVRATRAEFPFLQDRRAR